MYCVVDVHAGKNGEDVGLEECNQELKRGDRDRHDKRQDRATNTKRTKRTQRDNEACENLERNVACQHVRKKTNREADWTREERDDFNGDDQWHDNARHTAWHEQLEEANAMLVETVDNHSADDEQRQSKRHDDLAGDRIEIRKQADKVRNQNEHEQRENEWEELHALRPGRISQARRHKFISHFRNRLKAAWDQSTARRREVQKA